MNIILNILQLVFYIATGLVAISLTVVIIHLIARSVFAAYFSMKRHYTDQSKQNKNNNNGGQDDE